MQENLDPYVQFCSNIVRKNTSKIIVAFVVLFVCSQAILYVSMMSLLFSFSTLGTLSVFVSFAIMFCMIACFFALIYGFSVMMLLFVRAERAVLGHVFIGFRQFKRMFAAGIPYTLILFFSSIVSSIVAFVVLGFDISTDLAGAESLETLQIPPAYLYTALMCMGLSFILFVPFLFFPLELYVNPYEPVRKVMVNAIKRLMQNIRLVFLKWIKTIWKELLILILCILIQILQLKGIAGIAGPACAVCGYILFAKSVIIIAICFHRLSDSCDILIQ